MTLQSSFELDIFVKVTTRSSQTIIDARGLEEVFSLFQYAILALIASLLAVAAAQLDRMIDCFIEPMAWLKVGLFFILSFGKGLCKELVVTGI